ncbi:MAG TPA: ABC transporter permease [Vicinamibacterales bacterium]
MGRLRQDIRFAVRTAIRTRSVAMLAILAFALGIGVTTAVFSIFSGVLLAPLAYPEPDQLVLVYDTQPACKTCPASYPKYVDWKTRNQVFSAIGGSTQASFVMTGSGAPEQVTGVSATASLADVFRVPPQMGRWYSEAEDQFGGPKVVVLGYRFWQRRLNGDPSIVGRNLTFDGEAYQVIGVMPATFNHRNADVFVPLQRKLDLSTRGKHFLTTYARLKPGVPLDRATREMRQLGEGLAREFGTNHGIDVRSLREATVGLIRGPLQVLMGAVVCVLLIACANVANLLLASGMSRRREIAVRLALGAGQRQIARQLTSEALVLAAAGGGLGLLLALWIVRVFVALGTNALPRAATIQIDGRVLAFTAAVTILVGIVCGLSPLLRLRLHTLTTALREGDTRTGSGGSTTFGNGLVVAEIAIAFALLVGAGLMVKNLILLEQRDAGFSTDHVIAFDVSPSGPRYRDDAARREFYRTLDARLAQLGGVFAVGLTSHLPMYRFGSNGEMAREGGNPWGPNDNPLVEYCFVYGDYLKALAIPVLRGRALDGRDGADTRTVLVNQAMADKFWPNEDPIGRRFGQGDDPKTYYTVVGVIGTTRSFGLAAKSPFEFYQTTDQVAVGGVTVVLRSTGVDPSALVPSARSIVSTLDPALPVTTVQTMEEVVSKSVGQPRLYSALSGLFGALAGLLAMVGVYGVTAYNVRRQRREYGIRLALGADPGSVQRLIVRRGAIVAATGIAIGCVAGLLLTRLMATMLNDVKPTDPAVFAGNAVLVLAVSMAACYLPARWAGRVDPALVLRND